MDEKLTFDRGSFNTVWARVGGGSPLLPEDREDDGVLRLRRCITAKAAELAVCTALAAEKSFAAERLRGLLSEERAELRKLQVEHFLLCGDTQALPQRHTPHVPLLPALREAWRMARTAAERERHAAEAEKEPVRKALYASLGAAAAARAAALRELIAEALS